jgi:Helix-turn-helix domain
MGRKRDEREEVRTLPEDDGDPIPLDPVNVLAGIGAGLDLVADPLPTGIADAQRAQAASVSVAELGRMLRLGEASIRKLIRTAVIRPVIEDGKIRIPLKDIEAYRTSVHRGTQGKPGE